MLAPVREQGQNLRRPVLDGRGQDLELGAIGAVPAASPLTAARARLVSQVSGMVFNGWWL
jgi:hypothetical protein